MSAFKAQKVKSFKGSSILSDRKSEGNRKARRKKAFQNRISNLPPVPNPKEIQDETI